MEVAMGSGMGSRQGAMVRASLGDGTGSCLPTRGSDGSTSVTVEQQRGQTSVGAAWGGGGDWLAAGGGGGAARTAMGHLGLRWSSKAVARFRLRGLPRWRRA
ncbi:hypothetical protein GUJ93_ZPchr0012g19315 [Zizania palustris]|uniref:Uncharacterized protein n=1 Tax=Zizania palustris TaxID=103762 RepID=A0A8J5WU91_ZIZPA|nr:hypothetical protein GUJ93_ZPchr0012g19315 [Zizania palustris]